MKRHGGRKKEKQTTRDRVTVAKPRCLCARRHAHSNMLWPRPLKLAIHSANLGLMITEVTSMSVTSLEPLCIRSVPPSLCSTMGPGGKGTGDRMTWCLTEWSLMKSRTSEGFHNAHQKIKKKWPLLVPGTLAPHRRGLARHTITAASYLPSKWAAVHRRLWNELLWQISLSSNPLTVAAAERNNTLFSQKHCVLICFSFTLCVKTICCHIQRPMARRVCWWLSSV